jgi:hypothetical protein
MRMPLVIRRLKEQLHLAWIRLVRPSQLIEINESAPRSEEDEILQYMEDGETIEYTARMMSMSAAEVRQILREAGWFDC